MARKRQTVTEAPPKLKDPNVVPLEEPMTKKEKYDFYVETLQRIYDEKLFRSILAKPEGEEYDDDDFAQFREEFENMSQEEFQACVRKQKEADLDKANKLAQI